jgi:hypothetical protein
LSNGILVRDQARGVYGIDGTTSTTSSAPIEGVG